MYDAETAARHLESVLGRRAGALVTDALALLAPSHASRAYAVLEEDWPVRVGGVQISLHRLVRERASAGALTPVDVIRLAGLRPGESIELGGPEGTRQVTRLARAAR